MCPLSPVPFLYVPGSMAGVEVPLPTVDEGDVVVVDVGAAPRRDPRDPAGWFRTLGLASDASYVEIRRVCNHKIAALHPDKQRQRGAASGAGGDSTDAAYADMKRMRDVLLDPGLRATYHTKGAEPALGGVSTLDGTEALHVEKQLRVSLRALAEGGSKPIETQQRALDGSLRRRSVTVSWPPATPADFIVVCQGKGHEKRVRDPVFQTEKNCAGNLLVTLIAESDEGGAMHAFGPNLKFTARSRGMAQNLMRCPIVVPHPDGRRMLQVVPPADRGFASIVCVPGAGLCPGGELWIITGGAPDADAVVVPPAASAAMCEANGWVQAPEVTPDADMQARAQWGGYMGSGPFVVPRIARNATQRELHEAETAAMEDTRARGASVRGRAALVAHTAARGGAEDTALTARVAHQTGVPVGEADSVTECATQ